MTANGPMVRYLKEAGVALVVAFVAGAIFLLCQIVYALLVLMPRLITSGSSLAVAIDPWWAFRVAALAFFAYLAWRLLRPNRAFPSDGR